MRINARTKTSEMKAARLAGGTGLRAANQSNENELKRMVLTCLLWEDNAYQDGVEIASEICRLIPTVSGKFCADLAVSARRDQKLRHVPLLVVREMCRYKTHVPFVRETVRQVCTRPDQLTELLALYWREGKTPISKQLRLGMADAMVNFDRYQLSKWNRDADIRLRDILFLAHPKPKDARQSLLFEELANGTLTSPDTWEVRYSAAKSSEEKKNIWEDMISGRKLGALAVLRNLRNMQQVGVSKADIRKVISECSTSALLPVDFIKAAEAAPDFMPDLEGLMFRCLSELPKIKGETVFVLDVSGSMACCISGKSQHTRLDVGISMAMMAAEICEGFSIYITAGNSHSHTTIKVSNLRGFGLMKEIYRMKGGAGYGGIFTRQCMNYLRPLEQNADTVIVFSDSQDCDTVNRAPSPFGKKNYIIDVGCHQNGINYRGVWDAEISGWSDQFLRFIAEAQ